MNDPPTADNRSLRRKVGDLTVYLVLRCAVAFIQWMPWFVVRVAVRCLAWLFYRIDRRHRAVAEDNIRQSFPDLPESDVQQLARQSFRHFVTMVFEVIRMPRLLNPSNVRHFVRYADDSSETTVNEHFHSGRPLLALSGHFGNWEVFSYVSGLEGYHASVVARRLDNPHINRFIERLRCKTGQRILDKRFDYPQILEALENGQMLGMLGDQDAGPKGLFVDFLHRPASTYKSIALLSLKYSAPILVFGAAREGHPMQYRLYLEDVILPEDYLGRPDAIREITQRYSDALRRLVERHPEQYFWFHRRWKSQPKSKSKPGRAAAA